MKRAVHTPGPWKACGTKIRYTFDGGLTETIADVRGGRFGEADDTPHANARLIAASPDLLEVATAFLAWIDSGNRGFPSEEKLSITVKKARAAIAKAREGA